jgi:hypothetical protein
MHNTSVTKEKAKMKNMTTKVTLAVAVLLAAAMAASSSGLNGSWTADVPRGNGRFIPATFTFQIDGDKLSGEAKALDTEFSIAEGKAKGDEISFYLDGATGFYTGKLEGDEIKMKVKFDGGESGKRTVPFVAKRVK